MQRRKDSEAKCHRHTDATVTLQSSARSSTHVLLTPLQHPADEAKQHLSITFSFWRIFTSVEAVTPYGHKNSNVILTQAVHLPQSSKNRRLNRNKQEIPTPWPSKIHTATRGPSIQIFHSLQQKAGTVNLNIWFFLSFTYRLKTFLGHSWLQLSPLQTSPATNNEVDTQHTWQNRRAFS